MFLVLFSASTNFDMGHPAFVSSVPLSPFTQRSPPSLAHRLPRHTLHHPTRHCVLHASASNSSKNSNPTPKKPSFPSRLTDVKYVEIDSTTGYLATSQTSNKTVIQQGTLTLPYGDVAYLPVSTKRTSYAAVYGREDVLSNPDLSTTTFIVFAHGFSQRPRNYSSLLRLLAAQGYVIVAPRTWIFSILFTKIETLSCFASPPAKLQTALLIDSARSLQVAEEYTSAIHLLGHSMGGAMMLSFAGRVGTNIRSVALMAPDAYDSVITELNQTVSLKAKDGLERMSKLAEVMAVNLMLLHGKKDYIVCSCEMEQILSVFIREAVTGWAELIKGTHLGFEDSLKVDIPIIEYFDILFFGIIDMIVFGSLDIFGLDTKEQLQSTKSLLLNWFIHAQDENHRLIDEMESTSVAQEISYSWSKEPSLVTVDAE
ncbi:unnamed protein product [Agarophyton chilense]|eukprot:gb/GEZJ01004301.1/.p1 GENE.gb/GEZJ01004301.1/~~gb/GEZJ01004301.1/.p1  ORF type:complete len:427 (-),score=54.27 gb/GEZJ01004301.1/:134-1414(-)